MKTLHRTSGGRALVLALTLMTSAPLTHACAQKLELVQVEGQPLAANVNRLLQALEFLGAPLPAETTTALQAAVKAQDASQLQQILDPHVLQLVTLNPESRVKGARVPAVP